MRILVVEDNEELFENMKDVFEKMLPTDQVSLYHIPTIQEAFECFGCPADVILMDFSLGAPWSFKEREIKDGADLISWMRYSEEINKDDPVHIIGISNNAQGNELMLAAGANEVILKNNVPQIAKLIAKQLEQGTEDNE